MGGDGTLRETAAGLIGGPVALGLLPAGTTNVLALALGVPRQPLAAARVAGSFKLRSLDVGFCQGLPFLMMASAGLDAAVMAGQNPALKKRFGRLAVVVSGLRHWWTYDYPIYRLSCQGEVREAGFFACCNIPQYGGPFRLAPGASPSDGRLDLVLLRGAGRGSTLGFARDLVLGRHLDRPDVERCQVEEIVVEGEGTVDLQIDGDVYTFDLPVRIRLRAAALQVLAAPL
jgi:diacylglycerol kinase family enzyme